MDYEKYRGWLAKPGWELWAPGCYTDYVESPVNNERLSVSVNIVHEHRFAFLYWATFFQKYFIKKKYPFASKPILISLDYHDDVGADSDCEASVLESLDISNKTELTMFCWSYLRSLNDGHILPALYLDMFSDVYILNTEPDTGQDRTYLDRNKNEHSIKYFNDERIIVAALETVTAPIYLDIDLDFFTKYEDPSGVIGSSKMIPTEDIEYILRLKNPLMSRIYPNLIGLTIATEVHHCGGYRNSMRILDILNNEFFSGSLMSDSAKWNSDT